MEFELAPLEGIGTHVFRRSIAKFYGEGITRYYTPFFAPHTHRKPKTREMQEIKPENNPGMKLIPQMLTRDADDLLAFQRDMKAWGYDEININLGCPSPTVVSKGRGSGFLSEPEAVNAFLYDVYSKSQGDITIKTRLGVSSIDEFGPILEIYNQYPIKELIIHFRLQKDYYKGSSRLDMYRYALAHSANPISYNGDIWTPDDYENILSLDKETTDSSFSSERHPSHNRVRAVMCGRGMVANPSLINTLSGISAPFSPDRPEDVERLSDYLNYLTNEYRQLMSGDTPVLYKLKEIWTYMIRLFPEKESLKKELLKTKKLSEYRIVTDRILH